MFKFYLLFSPSHPNKRGIPLSKFHTNPAELKLDDQVSKKKIGRENDTSPKSTWGDSWWYATEPGNIDVGW